MRIAAKFPGQPAFLPIVQTAECTRRPEGGRVGAMVAMAYELMGRTIRAASRTAFVAAAFVCCEPSFAARAFAASPGGIDLGSLTVMPARLPAGQQPKIEMRVSQARRASGASSVVNIFATVTRPDHRTRSWRWEKITLSRGAVRTITVPKEYDTSAEGTYRVEIVVYSGDMKHRLGRQAGIFEVLAEKPGKKKPSEAGAGRIIDTAGKDGQRATFGLGLYGNALNPAGGGMVVLWPSHYAGLEGIYSIGEFTSYEGRLIGRIRLSKVYGLFGGIGYIHVATDKDVLGVTTRFSDSSVSGVVGVEAAFGRNARLHVELSTARIDLEKIVTSGGQTVKAEVKYAPASLGVGFVLMVF